MKKETKVVEPIIFTQFDNQVAEEVKTPTASNQSQFDQLVDRSKHLIESIRQWYVRPSEAYSTIVGQEVSPKSIVRVNMMTIVLIVLCFCASEAAVVTGVTTACVGWIVYRARTEQPKKKGGRS